jgi:hypothetical protein
MTNKKMRGMVVSATSLLIFCACFMVSIGLAAAAPSLSIDPALTNGLAPGDTFSVTVNVNSDGISLDGLEFKLAYDTTTLSVTDATYDGLMGAEGSDVLTFKNFADDGEISFAAADNNPASQIGTVITVDFAVKAGAADGMYDLDLMDGILVNGINAIPGLVINDGEAQVGDDIVIPPEEDPFVQIIADSGTFGEGESFQATVVLDSQDYTVSGVELSLMYDNSAISVTGATYESLMGPEGSDVMIIKDLTDDGKISFSAVDNTPSMQNGDLLTIDFEVKTGAPDGFYDLDLMDVTVVNGINAIPGVDAIDDTVHINTVPAVNGIVLMPGWNLISIPETLEDPLVETVLQDFNSTVIDSVFYDDASTGIMVNPTDFEPLKAYWVHNNLTTCVVINKEYLTPMVPSTPPSLMLYPGWNAVGHTASVELSAEVALATIDDCYFKVQGPWIPSTSEYAYIGYNQEINSEDNHVSTDEFSMDVYEGYYVFVGEECMLA